MDAKPVHRIPRLKAQNNCTEDEQVRNPIPHLKRNWGWYALAIFLAYGFLPAILSGRLHDSEEELAKEPKIIDVSTVEEIKGLQVFGLVGAHHIDNSLFVDRLPDSIRAVHRSQDSAVIYAVSRRVKTHEIWVAEVQTAFNRGSETVWIDNASDQRISISIENKPYPILPPNSHARIDVGIGAIYSFEIVPVRDEARKSTYEVYVSNAGDYVINVFGNNSYPILSGKYLR